MSVQIGELMSTFGSVVAAGVTVEVAERPRVEEILRDCARVTSVVESVRLRAITCLDALPNTSPVENEDIVVKTSRGTRRQAQAAQKRADTVAQMPALANALQNGQVGSDHVDTVAQTLSRMEPSDRSKLAAESDQTLLDGAHARSRIDVSSGVTLPVETIRRMACYADIIPAGLGANGVVLDLGRSTRLASAHQRRALRVMYSTCAVGNCDVAFDNCTVQHVGYWRHGGRTDIANLLPVCGKHHHLAHEGGWKFHLDGERILTITKPDGSRQTHPPHSLAPVSGDVPQCVPSNSHRKFA
jgi:Domain of unknown function (DUF222)